MKTYISGCNALAHITDDWAELILKWAEPQAEALKQITQGTIQSIQVNIIRRRKGKANDDVSSYTKHHEQKQADRSSTSISVPVHKEVSKHVTEAKLPFELHCYCIT